jgi:nitrite reductase/ring-hydroxylating ferredoxin subunit
MSESSDQNQGLDRRTFLAVACAACACAAIGGQVSAADAPATIDAGPLSDFSADGVHSQLVNDHRVFIVRNDGRIYACSANCTHKRQKLKAEGSEIVCASHGSRFSIQGTVTKGPAKGSLVRYGVSVAEGRLVVDKSKSFAEKDWDADGAFVKV